MKTVGVLLRLAVDLTMQLPPVFAVKVPTNVSCPGASVPTVADDPFSVPVTVPVHVLLIGDGRKIVTPVIEMLPVPLTELGAATFHGSTVVIVAQPVPVNAAAETVSGLPATPVSVNVDVHASEPPEMAIVDPLNLGVKAALPPVAALKKSNAIADEAAKVQAETKEPVTIFFAIFMLRPSRAR